MKPLLSTILSILLISCATQSQQTGKDAERMGVNYLFGRGIKTNYEKAFSYFKQAANAGNPFAQNELAYLYLVGKGTPQNSAKAFYWYQQAAKQGLASAQYNLGLFYDFGIGTDKDPQLAKVWFEQAATRGFLPAKNASAS